MARRHGLAGLSLRELAGAVGMTAPSLYSYFSSKNDIYDAMYRQGYEAFGAHMSAHTPDSDDPTEIGTASAYAFMDFAAADPARFQLLFLRTVPGFEPSPESWDVALGVHRQGAAALVDRGVVDAAGLDLWTAVLTGLASQQLSNDPGGTRWRDLVPRAVAALVGAAQPHQVEPGTRTPSPRTTRARKG